jgi:hypothetical protein
MLDRPPPHATVVHIAGESDRLKNKRHAGFSAKPLTAS